jgi:selenocysteine lyase/cysteine desulfurase
VDGLEAVDGARVLSDRSAAGRSAIVTFAVDGVDSVALAERLNAQRFVCAPRGGGIRVAPHGYNTADEIDALIAEVVAQSGL